MCREKVCLGKVLLDVRDLGWHLDFTRRARAGTLSQRVRDAGALSIGFQVKLGLIRGKHLPAGLHAVEASYFSASCLRVPFVPPSFGQSGLVRCLWLLHRLFLLSWTVQLEWTLRATLLRPGFVSCAGVCRIVQTRFSASFVCWIFLPMVLMGMVQCMCWLPLLLRLGLPGMGVYKVGFGLPLPPLGMVSGPVQHFENANLEAWQLKVSTQLAERQGFRGAQFLNLRGSLQLRTSSHVRERDKNVVKIHFMRGSLEWIPSWSVPCRFCGGKDGDGHLFWDGTFLPILHVRDLPEFAHLLALDRSEWPRCLLWHGWLPGLV